MTSVLALVPGTKAWRKRRSRDVCARAAARIQEIVDGEVPPGKAARALERHIAECPPCHQEAEALRTLKQAIVRVSGTADPETVARLEAIARGLCERKEPH
ncbi:MAG TPA: zf-HC2 domain-containing protein [Actinomycetota bacterium]|nr:zf-HC2 domain-containing protein [Actinomycetota bacterium]